MRKSRAGTPCSLESCEELITDKSARGMCPGHYKRLMAFGDPQEDAPLAKKVRLTFCEVRGCDSRPLAKGLCSLHYQRKIMGTDMELPPRHLRECTSFQGAHWRVKSVWGAARQYPCVECGKTAAHWAYDGTDPTESWSSPSNRGTVHFFSSWPEFYMPMCAKCHSARDAGRAAEELREYRIWRHETKMSLSDIVPIKSINISNILLEREPANEPV